MKLFNIGDVFKLKIDDERMKSPLREQDRNSKSEYEYFLREVDNKIGMRRHLYKLGSELEQEEQVIEEHV